MIPSNPDNQQPLIYRICDALGVFHIVAPVNHTHSQSEIEGLSAALLSKADAADMTAALAGKQNTLTFDSTPTEGSTNPVTSGGVKAALDGKRDLVGQTISLVINGQEIEIESSDVPNLIRALSNPDSTPTENSTKLVTSGGVKDALNQKVDISDFCEIVDRLDSFTTSNVDEKINLPTVFDDDHYSTTYIIENYTSEDRTLNSFFNEGSDGLVCEPNKIIHPDSYVIAKVIRHNAGSIVIYFVVVEGIYEM